MSKSALIWFFVPLLVTLSLFCYPYIATRHAPSWDGNTVIGYPLTAYSFGGGLCMVEAPNAMGGAASCPPQSFPMNAVVDLVFVFAIPTIIFMVARTVSKRH